MTCQCIKRSMDLSAKMRKRRRIEVLHEQHERKSDEDQRKRHDGRKGENQERREQQKVGQREGVQQLGFDEPLFGGWDPKVSCDVVEGLRKRGDLVA